MFTPQEVSEKTFPKSPSFSSGYDLAAVDEFLDTLTEDYTALYKENAALKTKLKILAEKVEEYRATEDTMRSMLLAAQKMAASMTEEAKEKGEKTLADARQESERLLTDARNAADELNRDLARKTEAARQKLSAAETAMKDYIAKSLAMCLNQVDYLEKLPHSELPAAQAPAQEPAAQEPAAEAAPAPEQPADGRGAPGDCPGGKTRSGAGPQPGCRPVDRKGYSGGLRRGKARPAAAGGHGFSLRVQAGFRRAEVRPQLRA